MNNMLTRAISGAVFVSLLVFSILFGPNSFIGLIFILMLISVFEFSRMLKIKGIEIYLVSISLFLSAIGKQNDIPTLYTDTFSTLIILSVFIKNLLKANTDAIKELGNFFLCIAYACISYLFIL